MSQIEIKGLEKSYGDVRVLKGLSLVIEKGEFFTFVGPSGCGKSTLLTLIAGLSDPTGGVVAFDGVVINDLPPGQRDVSMVFQSYALYPHMTVFENIAFPMRVKKQSRERVSAEVGRIASLLGLEGFLERLPRELSGGQRQRVALGRAIARKPKVFLLDEPLSNLDQRLRVEMRGEIKKLHRELGITTVYVTHDQEEAMSLSDRVLVLKEGALQQCAPPMELYDRPANLFVAGFIGSPSMNFLPGRVTGREPPEISCGEFTFAATAPGQPPDGEVTVGVRPDDVFVSAREGEGFFEGVIEAVEPVGRLKWVDISGAGLRLKGRAPSSESFLTGMRAFFKLSWERAHLFNPLTGGRL